MQDLQRAQAVLADTLRTGDEIAVELAQQREVLLRAQHNVAEVDSSVSSARRIVRRLQKMGMRYRAATTTLAAFLVLGGVAMIYYVILA